MALTNSYDILFLKISLSKTGNGSEFAAQQAYDGPLNSKLKGVVSRRESKCYGSGFGNLEIYL